MKRFTFIILVFLGLNSYSQWPSNLKAYFTFNGNLNDSTANSSPGVNNGAVACADRMGLNNKAYEFNGSGNNINISADLSFGTTTIAFWFKPNNVTPFEQIMISNASNSAGITTSQIEIRVMATSKILVFLGNASNPPSSFRTILSNSSLNTSKWNHVTVVIENNFTNVLIYLNGSLDQGVPVSGLTYSKCLTSMLLGARSNPTNEAPYNGKIDEVMIFNKALSDIEARSIYTITNGIHNMSSNLNFGISPNPVSRNKELKLDLAESMNNFSLKLYSIDGKEWPYTIQSKYNKSVYLKMDNLIAGVYFLRLESEGESLTKKIMVLN